MIKGDRRMNKPEEAGARNEHSENPAQRRPYIKPEFSCERVFESTALACVNRIARTST